MRAHFFDLDVILQTNSKVWIIDKDTPSIPLMKITKSDFNLIRNGIFKGGGVQVNFAGHDYWLPQNLVNSLKIKSKNNKVDFSNLGFSMQEFMNKELIENLDFELRLDHISHIKNTTDDIYIICSKNSKKNYEYMIEKFESKLLELGIKVKKYYFISETFYNRSEDLVSMKKVRLLLQHLVGFKTENDKFTDEELLQYDEMYYYEDEESSVNFAKNCNSYLKSLIDNSEESVKKRIKDLIKEKEISLNINYCTDNRVNKFIPTRIIIEYANLIKTFERFQYKF